MKKSVLCLSLIALTPSSMAAELPRTTKGRCELVLTTAAAIAESVGPNMCGWFLLQDRGIIVASEGLDSNEVKTVQGYASAYPVLRESYVCRNRDFEVYRPGIRSRARQVLALAFTRRPGKPLAFSAYIGGWPEGEGATQTYLCSGASGTVKRIGRAWKVILDVAEPDESATAAEAGDGHSKQEGAPSVVSPAGQSRVGESPNRGSSASGAATHEQQR